MRALSADTLRERWIPLRHRIADGIWRPLQQRLSGTDLTRRDGACVLPPRWLILGVNNACNLRCRMCDVGLEDSSTPFWANLIGERPRNMPAERFHKALEQAAQFHPRPRIGIAYTEPLLHPAIVDLVRAAVARGFFCSLTTNGTLLPRRAGALMETGLHWLNVSLDGTQEIHDRIRGRRGSFEQATAGIREILRRRRLRGSRYPEVNVSFTITDENQEDIPAFVAEMEQLQVDHVHLSHLNFIDADMAAAHNALYGDVLPVTRSNLGAIDPAAFPTGRLSAALQQVEAHRRRGWLSIVPAATDQPTLDTLYRRPAAFIGGHRCSQPFDSMMIRTDGSVLASQGRCFDWAIGQIDDAPLTALWNSPRARQFRQILQAAGGSLPACSRCCGVIGKPV